MIIWLNGTFGVGKSAAVQELRRQRPDLKVHDLEILGWLLQCTLGRLRAGDHLRSWRAGTVLLLSILARRGTTIVVPMTVLRPQYLEEILTGIRARGVEVRHVLLDADVHTLGSRIAGDRLEPDNVADWRRRHVQTYLDARDDLARRGTHVDTVGRTPAQVAAEILGSVFRNRPDDH